MVMLSGYLLFRLVLSLVLGTGRGRVTQKVKWMELNSFTPDLFSQTPSGLKRCLRTQKMLSLELVTISFEEQSISVLFLQIVHIIVAQSAALPLAFYIHVYI